MIDDIPPQIVDQAIDWIVKLESDDATHATHRACEAWRASDPLHERAWQALQQIEHTFRLSSTIPAHAGSENAGSHPESSWQG